MKDVMILRRSVRQAYQYQDMEVLTGLSCIRLTSVDAPISPRGSGSSSG